MGPEEKDYAIAFAIPADTEGVYLIGREAFSQERDANLEKYSAWVKTLA